MCPLENINRKLSIFLLFLFFLFYSYLYLRQSLRVQSSLSLNSWVSWMLGLYVHATFVLFGLLCTLTFLSTSFPLLPTILVSTFQLQLCKSQTLIPYRAPLWSPFVDFILRDWQVYSELTLSDISGFLGLFLFLGLFPNCIVYLH